MKKYRQKPYTVPPWIHKAVQVLRPVERVTVSKWAEANRVLPDSNSIPGPWRNSVTPYLVEIMDAFSDEMVDRFAEFAKTSNPNVKGKPQWKTYSSKSDIKVFD